MDVEKQLSEYTHPSVRLLYVTRVLVISPLLFIRYFISKCSVTNTCHTYNQI